MLVHQLLALDSQLIALSLQVFDVADGFLQDASRVGPIVRFHRWHKLAQEIKAVFERLPPYKRYQGYPIIPCCVDLPDAVVAR